MPIVSVNTAVEGPFYSSEDVSTTRNVDIVFFSRGRGRGHATPDLAIVHHLRRLLPSITVAFVSYAVGADVFRTAGEDVVDVDLPEMATFFQTVTRYGHALRSIRTRLAVCHEEPGAIVAAKIFGIPSVYLSHWLYPAEYRFSEALEYADQFILMEKQGLFPEPKEACGRVCYVGPVLKPLRYRQEDRKAARATLSIAPDEQLILVLPGSPPEDATPIRDLVLGALNELSHCPVKVIWVAGNDFVNVTSRTATMSQIQVVKYEPDLDRIMVAADVAITKGTYNIGRELGALGIPSISLSHGLNQVDDLFARTFATNTFLWAKQTTPADLAKSILESLARGRYTPDHELLDSESAEQTATCLTRFLSSRPDTKM